MIKIGVCGNAGGRAQPRDIEMARIARAEVYKAMSHGDPREVDWCRAFNPNMMFILRLYIGGLDRRVVSAEQAARDWEHDLGQWYAKGVRLIEVHNEPNLTDEGWRKNWQNGGEFARWWLAVVAALRPMVPEAQWGFPGLSPGFGYEGRQESTSFLLEASAAVQAADWLAWHCYYENDGSLKHPAAGFSWQEPHRRFPGKPLHITEYSNPSAASFADKARQARLYAEALAGTPVQSAAYFCTGGDSFPHQVMWNAQGSTGIAEELGRRAMVAPPPPKDEPMTLPRKKMIVVKNGVAVRREGDPRTVLENIPVGGIVETYGPARTIDGWENRVYIDPPRRHVWLANLGDVPPERPGLPGVDLWRGAAEALLQAFGPERDVLTTMLAIGAAESAQFTQDRGDPAANYPQYVQYACDGYLSFGWWQVFAGVHFDKYTRLTGSSDPCAWYRWAQQPVNAALIAKQVLGAGNYSAWSVYKNGAYKAHLARAIEVVDRLLGEGWTSPVGDAASLGPDGLWMAKPERGRWFDANPYGNRYTDSAGNIAYHTGADLNWNPIERWDADAGQPVRAIGPGLVRYAGRINAAWSNVVVVEHDPAPDGRRYVARYAHLGRIEVNANESVARGRQLGTVGAPGGGPNHLHLDISPTEILLARPGDWPGLDRTRLERDYLPPRDVLAANKESNP